MPFSRGKLINKITKKGVAVSLLAQALSEYPNLNLLLLYKRIHLLNLQCRPLATYHSINTLKRAISCVADLVLLSGAMPHLSTLESIDWTSLQNYTPESCWYSYIPKHPETTLFFMVLSGISEPLDWLLNIKKINFMQNFGIYKLFKYAILSGSPQQAEWLKKFKPKLAQNCVDKKYLAALSGEPAQLEWVSQYYTKSSMGWDVNDYLHRLREGEGDIVHYAALSGSPAQIDKAIKYRWGNIHRLDKIREFDEFSYIGNWFNVKLIRCASKSHDPLATIAHVLSYFETIGQILPLAKFDEILNNNVSLTRINSGSLPAAEYYEDVPLKISIEQKLARNRKLNQDITAALSLYQGFNQRNYAQQSQAIYGLCEDVLDLIVSFIVPASHVETALAKIRYHTDIIVRFLRQFTREIAQYKLKDSKEVKSHITNTIHNVTQRLPLSKEDKNLINNLQFFSENAKKYPKLSQFNLSRSPKQLLTDYTNPGFFTLTWRHEVNKKLVRKALTTIPDNADYVTCVSTLKDALGDTKIKPNSTIQSLVELFEYGGGVSL